MFIPAYDQMHLLWNSDVTPNQRYILLAIRSICGGDGEGFPSQSFLSRMTGLGESTIYRLMRDLTNLGILVRKARYLPGGKRTSDLIKIDYAAIPYKPINPGSEATKRFLENRPLHREGATQNSEVSPFTEKGTPLHREGVAPSQRPCTYRDLSNRSLPIEERDRKPDKNSAIAPMEQSPLIPDEKPKKESSGKRKVKGKSAEAQKIYDDIENLELFQSVWVWYKTEVCKVGKVASSPGIKTKAAIAWKKLESTDFFGKGVEGFEKGRLLYLKRVKETEGVGVPHAERFLYGYENALPEWCDLLEEATEQAAGSPPEDVLNNQIQAMLESMNRSWYRGIPDAFIDEECPELRGDIYEEWPQLSKAKRTQFKDWLSKWANPTEAN